MFSVRHEGRAEEKVVEVGMLRGSMLAVVDKVLNVVMGAQEQKVL